MRVLYVVNNYSNKGQDAAEVRARKLVPELRKHVDLSVLSFDTELSAADHQPNKSEFHVATQHKLFSKIVGTVASMPRALSPYRTGQALGAFLDLVDRIKPGVIHFDGVALCGLAKGLIDRPSKPKLIAHTHDAVSKLYGNLRRDATGLRKADLGIQELKYQQLERQYLTRFDHIVVDSKTDRDLLVNGRGIGCSVHVIPIGVSISEFSPLGDAAPLKQPNIVFSGSMGSQQSSVAAEHLVNEVAPLVWTKEPNAHFYLVGANPSAVVQELAAPNVVITGFVENLQSYLRSATVYVSPLRLGSGMRTRILEALSCGAMVVGTPESFEGLVKPQERCWRVAETPSAMADEIMKIAKGDDPDMGVHARSYVERNYSWERMAEQIVDIYRS